MAPAALEDTMSSSFEAPTSTQNARNDDPWTPLARRNVNVYEQEPRRAPSSATASIGSSPTAVFSSREPSVVTKPTTNGTFYPVYDDNGKGKAIVAATYAASLSATHGSASEAEEERDDARRFALLGTGAWLSDQHAEERCLRRSGNAKVRLSKALPRRLKKPPFELHQTAQHAVSYESPAVLPAIATPTHIANGPRCLLDCVPRQHYVMLGMVSLVVTTIALGGVSIHRADSANLAHRKRVIVIATVLVTLETILTMFAARRTLLEALMLGFFPLVIGFMFLLHPEITI